MTKSFDTAAQIDSLRQRLAYALEALAELRAAEESVTTIKMIAARSRGKRRAKADDLLIDLRRSLSAAQDCADALLASEDALIEAAYRQDAATQRVAARDVRVGDEIATDGCVGKVISVGGASMTHIEIQIGENTRRIYYRGDAPVVRVVRV
jgi:hypothetical protein